MQHTKNLSNNWKLTNQICIRFQISAVVLIVALATAHAGYSNGPIVTASDLARVAHIVGAYSAPSYGHHYGGYGGGGHHGYGHGGYGGPVVLGYPQKAILADEWHSISGGYGGPRGYGGGGHHVAYAAPVLAHHGYGRSHY